MLHGFSVDFQTPSLPTWGKSVILGYQPLPQHAHETNTSLISEHIDLTYMHKWSREREREKQTDGRSICI